MKPNVAIGSPQIKIAQKISSSKKLLPIRANIQPFARRPAFCFQGWPDPARPKTRSENQTIRLDFEFWPLNVGG